jgi:hypothetical protein
VFVVFSKVKREQLFSIVTDTFPVAVLHGGPVECYAPVKVVTSPVLTVLLETVREQELKVVVHEPIFGGVHVEVASPIVEVEVFSLFAECLTSGHPCFPIEGSVHGPSRVKV